MPRHCARFIDRLYRNLAHHTLLYGSIWFHDFQLTHVRTIRMYAGSGITLKKRLSKVKKKLIKKTFFFGRKGLYTHHVVKSSVPFMTGLKQTICFASPVTTLVYNIISVQLAWDMINFAVTTNMINS